MLISLCLCGDKSFLNHTDTKVQRELVYSVMVGAVELGRRLK